MYCHGTEITTEARRAYEEANTVQQLRVALGNLLAVQLQRQAKFAKIRRTQPVYAGACACGCGTEIWQSPYGAPKRYVDHAHAERAGKRRRKAAAAA
jgi:hypothetical protein